MLQDQISFTVELRRKVEQLVQSGFGKKEAIAACNLEFQRKSSFPANYQYKGYQIYIELQDSQFMDSTDSQEQCWESCIHFPDQITVVAVGRYTTQLEAALMAERTINHWS